MTMSVRMVAMCVLMLSASFGQSASRLPVVQPQVLSFGTSVAVAQATSWHSMTQSQRNEAIISRAIQDNGKNTGMQCKVWVQNVVYSASSAYSALGGPVSLPQNQPDPNMYKWYPGQYVFCVTQNMCVPIENAQRGWIVQMYFKTLSNGHISPHTMIIEKMYPTSMDVIDCNFTPSGGTTVNRRNMTFQYFYDHSSDFYGNTYRYSYNLYYIL